MPEDAPLHIRRISITICADLLCIYNLPFTCIFFRLRSFFLDTGLWHGYVARYIGGAYACFACESHGRDVVRNGSAEREYVYAERAVAARLICPTMFVPY